MRSLRAAGRGPPWPTPELSDGAGADGATAFADREAQPQHHRDRRVQRTSRRPRCLRHHISTPAGNVADPVTFRRPESKTAAIPEKKAACYAASSFVKNVHLALELLCGVIDFGFATT